VTTDPTPANAEPTRAARAAAPHLAEAGARLRTALARAGDTAAEADAALRANLARLTGDTGKETP
jgi:hypothetical protein